MAKKFLDSTGLTTVWNKITTLFARKTEVSAVQNELTDFKATKGVANGLATLGNDGRIPSTQLPSYVDDVLSGYYYNGKFYKDSSHTELFEDEDSKIYVDKDTNKTYRWDGNSYIEISQGVVLGETEYTAYRGDRGKLLYDVVDPVKIQSDLASTVYDQLVAFNDHAQDFHNPHRVDKADLNLNNVDNTSDLDKPISTATQTALNNKLDKKVNGKYAFTETSKGISIDAMEDSVGTFIEVTQTHIYIANGNVWYSFGISESDKLKFHSGESQYEVLDESMALSASDINTICV